MEADGALEVEPVQSPLADDRIVVEPTALVLSMPRLRSTCRGQLCDSHRQRCHGVCVCHSTSVSQQFGREILGPSDEEVREEIDGGDRKLLIGRGKGKRESRDSRLRHVGRRRCPGLPSADGQRAILGGY